MRRREFIAILGSTAAVWPLAARAQPERLRRIGYLHGLAENDPEAVTRMAAFRQGLAALGWTEGRNIRIDFRHAGSDIARIRAYAAELVNSAPDLIVVNTSPVVAAAKEATSTIPIVFALVNDPLGQGFVANLARPGGNLTGFTFIDPAMIGKWLELLKQIASTLRRAAFMFNPQTADYYPRFLREVGAEVATLGVALTAAQVVSGLAREPGGGLIAAADPFNVSNRPLILRLAERHRVPALYHIRQIVAEGGLMSYGPDADDICRRSADYVDRILKGAKPADLPVQSPAKFELVINLKTAKALGLTVPPMLLARADEVIE
jgi:putative tryptophan/tyrosine transport system substrate-binding protein